MTLARILSNYFYYILHPFKLHRSFGLKRNKNLVLLDNDILGQERELIFHEAVSISWIFVIINGIYSLISVQVSRSTFLKFGKSDFVTELLSAPIYSAYKASIFWSLMNIVFFPLIAFLIVKYWEVIIRFGNELFSKRGVSQKSLSQVTISIIPAYAFLSIPVFGDVFKNVAMMLFLFAGLRNNIGYSPLQAVVVILTPLLLLSGLVLLLTSFLLFVLSGL